MSGEIRAFFFHQITSQEESGCKSFLSDCGSVGMRARLVGRLVLCFCPNATGDDLSSRSHGADYLFRTFVDYFIVALVSNQLQKTLEWKVADWLKKKDLLIVNIKLHFNQMDARRLPVQRRVLFILVSAIVKTTSSF